MAAFTDLINPTLKMFFPLFKWACILNKNLPADDKLLVMWELQLIITKLTFVGLNGYFAEKIVKSKLKP